MWDRAAGAMVEERIVGGAGLAWLYGSPVGRLAAALLSRHAPARLFGRLQSGRASARRIPAFVERYGIPLDQFEPGPYPSFNEFFIRRFRPGKRPFERDPQRLPAFAEGRYLAFERVDGASCIPVKGGELPPSRILGEEEEAGAFVGGPLLVARLCPVDYHRYHYPEDGETVRSYRIAGPLHSVHPFALAARPGVLRENERRISLLRTSAFGRMAYVEVGAMNVGAIVQTHDESEPFRRGDEKGYFLLGGSTVLLFGEPGRWVPDADLLERTAGGTESLVRLGEGLAASPAGEARRAP